MGGSRVLKPTGTFMIISYGVPDNRLSYLENEDYGWTVTVHTVAKPTVSATAVPDTKDANSVHYIYVCVKGGSVEVTNKVCGTVQLNAQSCPHPIRSAPYFVGLVATT